MTSARRGGSAGGRTFQAAGVAALALTIGFVLVPILALVLTAPIAGLPGLLSDPTVRDALLVTLQANALANALILLVGTPAAYLLATRSFPGRRGVVTLLELPIVLPPAVAGLALLVAFGPDGPVGRLLAAAGILLPLTPAAVVLAVTFVALPFYLRQAIAAFEAIGEGPLDVARTLGASPGRVFLRVALPLARPGLIAGWAVAFARGAGEFGATIVFAGSIPGVTATAPLAIYQQLNLDLRSALGLAVLMLALAATVLALLGSLGRGARHGADGAQPAR